jgi:hypothetical protein
MGWCIEMALSILPTRESHHFIELHLEELKIDKDRKRILERKARSRQVADKGKHTEEYIMETS